MPLTNNLLSSAKLEEVRQKLTALASQNKEVIPVTVPEGQGLMGLVDAQMLAAEDAILAALTASGPTGAAAAAWLGADRYLLRSIMENMAKMRKEETETS